MLIDNNLGVKMKFRYLAIIPVFLLSACTSLPPLNFSVPNVGPSSVKLDADVKSMTVTVARPDEAAGSIPSDASGLTGMWKEALQEAFDKMAIFKDSSKRKVSVSVKILKLDVPSAGFSMTTSTTARYEIRDRSDGSIIYTQDISADGVVPADYAFKGVVRARESINRSVQKNISEFLQSLETVDLDKPMFPAKNTEK